MKQHYLPKTYLRGFQDANRPGFIWLYQRTGEPRLVNIEKVAKRTNIYTFLNPDRSPTNEVEQMFSKLESQVTPLLKAINTGSAEINMALRDKATLAWFTAYQWARTPAMQNAQLELLMTLTRDVATSAQAEFREQEARQDTTLPKLAMLAALEQAPELVQRLMTKPLEILRAIEDSFVLSDYPVSEVNPPVYIVVPHFFELFIPVGSKAGILWAHGADLDARTRPDEQITVSSRNLNANNVQVINASSIRSAEDFVFACEENATIAAYFREAERPNRVAVRGVVVDPDDITDLL